MKELRIHPNIKGEAEEHTHDMWGAFMNSYGNRLAWIVDEVIHNLGARVIINWACTWNSIGNVGKEAIVLATNDSFCIIKILGCCDEYPIMVYRCEDIHPKSKQ